MNTEFSRRKILSGLVVGAGAAVLGWDPQAQAWAAAPGSTSGIMRAPRLDGKRVLPADSTAFSEDFGHLFTRRPPDPGQWDCHTPQAPPGYRIGVCAARPAR